MACPNPSPPFGQTGLIDFAHFGAKKNDPQLGNVLFNISQFSFNVLINFLNSRHKCNFSEENKIIFFKTKEKGKNSLLPLP